MMDLTKEDYEMMQEAAKVAQALMSAMSEQKLSVAMVTMASCAVLAQALCQIKEDCGDAEFEEMLQASLATLNKLREAQVSSNVVLN